MSRAPSGGPRLAYALRAVGSMGNGLLVFAAPVLVYELTGSLAWSGMAFFVEWLPRLTSLPTAGPVVEIFGIRKVFLVNDAIRVVAAALTIWALTERVPWAPYAVVTLAALCGFAFEQTFIATEKAVQLAVPGHVMHRAQSVLGGIEQTSLLLAPALGGALLLVSDSAPIVAAGIAFAVSLALAVGLLRPEERPCGSTLATLPRRLGVGLRYVATQPVLRVLVAMTLVVNLMLGYVIATMPAFVTSVFDRSPSQVGLVYAIAGAASIAGAAASPWLIDRVGLAAVAGASAVAGGIGFTLAIAVDDFVAFVVLITVLMVGDTTFAVVIRTVRATLVPSDIFASVVGITVLFNFSVMPVAGLAVTLAGSVDRARTVGLYGGVVLVGLAVLSSTLLLRGGGLARAVSVASTTGKAG